MLGPIRESSVRSLPDWAMIATAVLASAVAIQLMTELWELTLAYAGALIVFIVVLRSAMKRAPDDAEAKLAAPDWSVTVAAIERPDVATVITERSGKVVCANSRYGEWFGFYNIPPQLALDEDSQERLARTAREAWRKGEASTDALVGTSGRWHAVLRRAGRGQNYLVWELAPVETVDLAARLVRQLDDKLGRALGIAGIHAVAVSANGEILGTNGEFARRAAGEIPANLVGREFVEYLTADEYDRIFYAREGTSGDDLRLIHLPIVDPDIIDQKQSGEPPVLFLIIEGGLSSGNSAALPEIESLLALLPLGLAMTDREGRFLFANKAFRRAAGLETHGEIPPYPSDLVVREDKGALADSIRRHAAGTPSSGAMPVRLHSTPDDPVALSLAGVRGLGEAAVLLSLKDTTEETRLKRQVAQATKMQAVGQLAGGVAHDFNNVLTAIIGYCDLMLLRHAPGDSDYDDIQQIKANSNRAASLTRQLLAFSRQQTLRPQVLQLPDIVSEVSALLKRLIGEKIRLEVKHDRALGAVRADPQQLEQVIVNLAVNARDAMLSQGDSGTLTISTRKVSARDVRALKNEILPPGNYTALIVEDTGEGIPADNIGKIFEPFYSTKETGKGTGLGLSTVYGIVKQSDGFIFAESEPGQGARFTVYLPVHVPVPGEIVTQAKIETEPRAAFGGTGRILLVEDEDTVRAVAERALVRQGYTVTAASDGEEGLEVIRAGGEFDLIISDVVMPTMDGPAMAREIRKIKPDLPILFMSGYAEEQLRREIDIASMYFLPKPFSVAQIGEKVAGVLGAARG
ncbi:hybrid sensor histidine kinase/response regulator [Croceicoccus naphthovorans]|uniref:histidine kinase n=1 Tax=Croceicoccus naphthovorans TaxID=1348774 RepID=A0A0G3XGB2_9SPHN|nr:response regulator [Croceicoccus naphthovorans]AKM09649.1 histidine kinase [Croceicoccus naphthovorans]MBB3990769.1 two-component system cell cycle sensor histidine kinase/response regulator CckA [Croceicoccus naphthovorans]